MKVLVTLACVFAGIIIILADHLDETAEIMNMEKADIENCRKENNISKQDLERLSTLHSEEIANEEELLKNYGCFMACINEKSGMMKNGEIDLAEVHKVLDRMNVTDINDDKLKSCSDKASKANDACIGALAFVGCLQISDE